MSGRLPVATRRSRSTPAGEPRRQHDEPNEPQARHAQHADEAFATSSAGGVLPITRVDDKPLGNGAMGIVTSQLVDSYWRNREAGWCGTKISDLLDS